MYLQSLLSKLLAHISCYKGEAGYKWDDVKDTLFVRPGTRVSKLCPFYKLLN